MLTVFGVVWTSSAWAVVGITSARHVTSGDLHSCALAAGGRIECWGDNSYGQLGDGTKAERTAPVVVPGITAARQVSGGGDHTCALLASGRVTCWGYNGDGQLGDGSTTERLRPVAVKGMTHVVMIAAGFYETCALLAGGSVSCWGANAYGDLGDGTARGPEKCGLDWCSRHPVAVREIAHARSITVGAFHACAALTDGEVRCWGFNHYGQLGDGTRTNSTRPVAVAGITTAKSVSASTLHSCALLAGGSVECWGDNYDGQLGDGTLTGPARCAGYACSTRPVRVIGITDATRLSAGGDTSAQGDGDHACAVIASGTVKCWGANYSGELGDGATVDRSTPVSVRGVARATDVAAGGYTSCAVFGGGRITCWGDNSSGELGSETTTGYRTEPVAVKQLSHATSAVAGGYHSCAVLVGGKVACWGDNTNGELGNGAIGEALTQVPVNGITGATQVAAGNYHSCAVLGVGTVQCWGDNSYGELGDGTVHGPGNCEGDPCSPVPVVVRGITTATQVTASDYQSCALLAAGSIDCWGANAAGELGDGTTITRSTPVSVSNITAATQVAAGAYHACALLAAGSIDCWGNNYYGQLGNGTTANTSTPAAVKDITTAAQIAAGAYHACALVAGGSIDCWGNNYYGQLGNGTTANSSTPVAVRGISSAIQIAAGYYDTCALLSTGRVDCWGYNFNGELGDGTATGPQTCGLYDNPCTTIPASVNGITTATQISVGGDPSADSDGGHACAVLAGGEVKCWGANFDGQLGDGTAGYSVRPVLGRTAVAIPVSGVVSVELPRDKSAKTARSGAPTPGPAVAATRSGFVRLTAPRTIPIGSRVDARLGSIEVITATGRGRQTQSGRFGGGAFTVHQSTKRDRSGLTTLTLLQGATSGEPGHSVCGAPKVKSGTIAHASSHPPLSRRVLQTLRASAHGSFRTRGRYSAGTVRGTTWDTINRCDGTLTIVHAGMVLVTDFATHKSIAVHAGHSYLAKAP